MTVRVEGFLVVGQKFSRGGYPTGKPSVRFAKLKPAVDGDEVALAVWMDLPNSLFLKPSLSVRFTVADSDVPAVITPEVQHNIAKIIQDTLGLVMHITAPQEEPDA